MSEGAATPYARIVGNLEELGLDSMAANAGEYMSMVADGRKSFPEALLEMTSAEVELRRERVTGKQIEKASFPYVKTLADFDWSFQPSVPRAEVEDLATLGFVERHENVVLVGSPGVGKTHIAVALGVEAVRARKLTYFVGCQRLVSDLERANSSLLGACVWLNEGDHPKIHSDRGCHYRWPGWIKICKENGLVRSMSRKGCSPDNARCEGYFGRLKIEFFYGRDWGGVTIGEFMGMLDAYLRWYRDVRIKGDLDYRSPMQYRRDLGLAA